jgi:hypothetical protein
MGHDIAYTRKLLHEIGILFAHIFGIPTEDADSPVIQFMHLSAAVSGAPNNWREEKEGKTNLGTFSVVLVLARKLLVLKSVQNFANSFGRFSKHGFKRHARRELACFA